MEYWTVDAEGRCTECPFNGQCRYQEMNVKHKCNNKMKNYTDLEQSRRLAKILPIESADMYYAYEKTIDDIGGVYPRFKEKLESNDVPCWSMAALIELMSIAYIECVRRNLPHWGTAHSNFVISQSEDGKYSLDTHFYSSKGNCLTDAVVNQIEALIANGIMAIENGKLKMFFKMDKK